MNRPVHARLLSLSSPLTVAAVLVGTLALSGCGVSLVNDDSKAASQTPRSTGSGSDPVPTTSGDSPSVPDTSGPSDPAPSGSTDSTGGQSGEMTYASFAARLAKVNKEIPCDRGPVDLTESGPAIRLVGQCGQVTISGDATSVIADEVDSLTVSGSGVVLMTKAIKNVTLTADAFASEVYWTGGQPNVNDIGAGNTVRKVPEGP